MAKPTAYFSFNANGLSVTFTDRSSGIITSWFWNFGFQVGGVDQTSTQQNPPTVTFPNAGIYKVSLSVTNSEGSDTYVYEIFIAGTPVINSTIKGMVQCDLPAGINLDNNCFDADVKKWQLFLQNLVDPPISDTDVFDETKWTSLQRVLISKLIVLDMIKKAASSAIISFSAAQQAYNSMVGQVTQNTIYVADYTVTLIPLDFGSAPFIINLFEVNGKTIPVPGAFASMDQVITALNNLNLGHFYYDAGQNAIVSVGNTNIITTFNYTHTSAINTAFTPSNPRVVPMGSVISSGGTSASSSAGPIKRIEMGPSVAEWYDSSIFWSNIFKGFTNSPDGTGQGGLLGFIINDICMFASQLRVQLYLCPKLSYSPTVFSVARRGCC